MATVPQPPPKLPALLLALAMVLGTAAGVRAATATWDPNTEPDLAGYRLSYGTQPGVHTFFVDVGLVTTYTFNPPGGQRIYVVVQAYNTAGDLSNKSAEVIVDIPGPPPAPGVPLPAPGPPFQALPPEAPPPAPIGPPGSQPPVAPQPPGPPIATPTPLRLIQPPNQASGVNTNVVLTVNATHLENKPFTFSAAGLPPGLSLNSGSGVISGTPRTIGFYRVTVSITDGIFTATGDFNWSIVDSLPAGSTTNRPPAIALPENQKSPVNYPVAYALSGFDPEGQPLTFSATGLPPGLSIDRPSGVISGSATTLGSYDVTVTVSDGELSTAASFTWVVVNMTLEEIKASKANADAAKNLRPEEDYVDVAGDFDGDGRPDLATYRRSSSEWRIWTSGSNFATPTVMVWGTEGDRPVAADYNGDRVTDFAVYRPSTGTWHLSLSGTQTPLAFQWGGPEDVPVPLDYDGDGKADLGLIRGGGYEILLSGANYLKSVRVF